MPLSLCGGGCADLRAASVGRRSSARAPFRQNRHLIDVNFAPSPPARSLRVRAVHRSRSAHGATTVYTWAVATAEPSGFVSTVCTTCEEEDEEEGVVFLLGVGTGDVERSTQLYSQVTLWLRCAFQEVSCAQFARVEMPRAIR